MAKNDSRLLSGRVKTKSGTSLDTRRNDFLSLDNAEPNLGNPDSDRYVLASLADGTRLFLNLNNGFIVNADSVSGDETTFSIDPSGLANAVGTTLADVLDDLDSAITLAFGSGVIHDNNFNGAGTVESQLSLDSDLRIFGITGDSATFTNITRTGTTVTAGTYGAVTAIPVLTVDASGFLDSISEVSISTTLNTSGETGTGSVNLLNSSLEIAAGEGINTVASGATITIEGEDASVTNKGVASFDSAGFTVTSGQVFIKVSGVGNSQLENDTVTIGSTDIALGETSDTLSGLTQVNTTTLNVTDSATIVDANITGIATIADLTVDSDANLTHVYVSDLTDSRVVIVGASGRLEDDANLAYNGSTLTVSNNTASTNSANGALVVTGGVGIGGALNVNGNTEISGDLIVTGTTTTIEVQTLAIQDPLIHLADSNESGDEVDIGFVGHYYDAALGGRQHTGLFRDATDDKYYLFAQYQDSALDSSPRSNVIDRSDPSFVLADFNVAAIVADTFSGTVSADSITTTNFTATTVDINGGTIDGTTIATSDITVGTGKTLDVSAGTLTLTNDQISGDKVEGGTIDTVTVNNLTSGNVDINGGFIDGTAIGHTTPDSGTFTNLARTSPSGVTAGAYGSVTEIPVITLDASGFVDSIGQVAISTTLNTAAETGTGTVNLLDSSLEIAGGVGINTSATGRTITISGEDASISNKGIASFASGDFDVSSGAVSIKDDGVGNAQLEFDSVTVTAGSGILGGGSVALGNSVEVKLDSGAVKGLFSGGNNIDYNNSTGEISASVSGVVAGTYGAFNRMPIITVDSYGQVDSIGLTVIEVGLADTVDSVSFDSNTGQFRLTTDITKHFTVITLDPYTTNDLVEGDSNKYYTKIRVDSDIDQAFNENPSFGGTGAPFSVANDTKITNLNADKLDGYSFADFMVLSLPAIKTNGDVRFNDDVLLTFGQSDDLRIYHDQNTSYINEIGTGDLKILTNGQSIILEDSTNDKVSGQFTPSTSVELYYAGNKKFETTNTGVDVTGIIAADSGTLNNNRILTTADEGSGNGLDADTLDGLQSIQFLRSDQDDSIAGTLFIDDSLSANNITRRNTTVTAGTYGSTTGIPVVTVDGSGFVDSIGLAALSTILSTSAETGTGSVNLLDSSLDIAAGSGIDTIASGNTVTVEIDSADLAAYFSKAIVHDNTNGFVADEHVAHSSIDINAGNGLTGGGNIASSRTLNVGEGTGITVTADAISTNDGDIVHDNLSGFVPNEHIDHSSVSINAGKGLTGGGDITSSLTIDIDSANVRDMFSGGTGITYNNGTGEFAVGAGTGIRVNTNDIDIDSSELATYYSKVINHDSTSGFVADEHIGHSNVNIASGNGLTGGGDITQTRTLNVGEGTGITVGVDTISTNDAEINHDNLSGFVPNEHIDHSSVSITAGDGLTGGGTIASNRTLNVGEGTGITVTADAISTNDAEINHDNLSGFVPNEHIDHSGVSITAGKGLTGGGDITTNRTIDIDSANVRDMFSGGTGITYNNGTGEFTTTDGDIVHDNLSGFVGNEHIDHSAVEIRAGAGLTGGGDITSTRTLNVVGGDGITANADEIEVTVDDATIELSAADGSGVVRVKDGGITNAKLQYDSSTIGTTSIVLGGSTTTLDGLTRVDIDNVRIDGNTISTTGGSYMYIDPHPTDSAGTLVILGNLSVEGTTTTIKSTTVTINDHLIVLADSATDNASANGAGIQVNGSNATITYDGGTDRWDFNKPIEVSTVHGALSGNATTATTATNVTATANNSTNETVYLTFVDGPTGTQGIETDDALTYNPSTNTLQIDGSRVLTTADEGTGNGLDADTLDGEHADKFQTVDAPNAPSITSTTVVGETIEIVFGQSSTSGVTRYEVWSDGATGSDYSLIAIIPSQDAAASMSVVDLSFDTGGTVAYRVYAIKNGVYSTAATTTKSFTLPSLDVTNMSVVASITNYDIQYDLPETRFLDHIEIYKDAETTLGALSRTGAALVYSGSSDNFTFNVSAADIEKYHQFWVECVSV